MKAKVLSVLVFLISIFIINCGKNAKGNKTINKTNSVVQNKATQSQQNINYLTTQDVEKVSGIKNIISVPKGSIPGAGGDLNYATEDSNLIVMIQITDKSNYESYKSYYFKSEIKFLGDEAMEGATMKGVPDNIFVFKKGEKCVALTVFMDQNDFKKNMLSHDQVTQLAKIIDSKI